MPEINDYKLKTLEKFKGRSGPLLEIIMDGVGLGKHDKGDAFWAAQPTHLLNWMKESQKNKLYTQLKAHGPAVGLPTEKDMGNSEVGHNALGSGQIYAQGAKLVNVSLDKGTFFKTEQWDKVVVQTAKNNGTVHLFGLLSDGNVHSHISQLFKILDGLAKFGVKKIRVHPLLDGRDVPPTSGLIFIEQLEEKLKKLESDFDIDAKIGSGGGRMHMVMDRYESDWGVVKRGWEAMVHGVVDPNDITENYPGYFTSAKEAIETARKEFPDKQDQYNPVFVIVNENNEPIGKIHDGDAVINFNFRGDRAIEITKAFVMGDDFTGFDRGVIPKVQYAGLLEYDSETHLPPVYLVPPPDIENVSGEYLCSMGIKSFAIAETHKFGHVTYFWNGNRTGYINEELEEYVEIESDPSEMIESKPEMKAKEVTDRLIEALESRKFKYLRVNYANGDMVGHTGNFDSCVRAMKQLDKSLSRVVDVVLKMEGVVVITADHGNVEEKLDKKGNVKTSHTLNPVPFFILDSQYKGEYVIDVSEIETPGIANVAATIMNLLGFEAPDFYENSLIRFV